MKKWIAVAALTVTPIFFLPITQDFYDTNKLLLLSLAAALILIFNGFPFISSGVVAFGALLLASLVSLFFASTNRVDALMSPLGPVALAALTILVSAAARTPRAKTVLTWSVFGTSAILGLIAIYQIVGMSRVMFPTIAFLQDTLWTPTGNTTTTIAIFAVSLALLISFLREIFQKHRQSDALVLLVITGLITVIGAGVTIWQSIPKIASSVLPLPVGWAITLELLKHAKTAVAGIGSENFLTAYTMGKPLWLTTTPLWNIRFGVNADFFLHMTTIYGLLGLAAAITLARLLLANPHDRTFPARLVACIGLLLVPPTLAYLTVIAILFCITGAPEGRSVSFHRPWLKTLTALVCIGIGVIGLYAILRGYTGEIHYFRALSAAKKSEGTNTYNVLIQAISTNRWTTRYRITFAQTSLAITNSLATSAKTDVDRQLVSQLIQQAIAQAKAAVSLNTKSLAAWENLGNIYQALMPVAAGSDAWAAAAYKQTLALDPTNPVAALDLGGALVHQQKYDEAIDAFNRAIFLKSDYANAYYNLAHAYQLKGDVAGARAAFTKTMSLVPPDSSDYTKAKNELESL